MANVELPQLGESVTEGIITAWLVEVGDTVEVDQPIVEISTDKVDTEIPSPVAGTVQELKAGVDDTIEVGQVIAVIGEGDPAGSVKRRGRRRRRRTRRPTRRGCRRQADQGDDQPGTPTSGDDGAT
jgi:pyruvate/2-oxoglutarate dehydrogenase complex dihydrolipoamide acyltransferase (E2) component